MLGQVYQSITRLPGVEQRCLPTSRAGVIVVFHDYANQLTMRISNEDIVRLFSEMAAMLEIKGDSVFKSGHTSARRTPLSN